MKWLAPSRLVGMAAPPTVWAVHFVVVYGWVGLACSGAWDARTWLGVRLLIWMLLAWTLVALALTAWLGRRAHRMHRRIECELEAAEDAAHPALARQCFTARVTTLLAGLAAIAIAFTAVPMFVLPDCA